MERLLYKTYRTVEGHYGSLGEIGIDIGLDKSGKLWIIECNPLSAKVSLMKAYGGENHAHGPAESSGLCAL